MKKGSTIAADHQRLMSNLKLMQNQFGVDGLSDAIGAKSKATWHNRMKEPWRLFSYDDLRAIAKYCNVDFVQLIDGYLTLK